MHTHDRENNKRKTNIYIDTDRHNYIERGTDQYQFVALMTLIADNYRHALPTMKHNTQDLKNPGRLNI